MSTAIKIADSHTDEWHAARTTGIGASEAAAACGVSEWDSPFSVYAKKTGLVGETPDNDAMFWGRKLEPIVLERWLERSGYDLRQYPCPMYRHRDIDWQRATPDAELSSGDAVEIKTTNWRRAKTLGQQGTDEAPAEWVMQCQQQMAVCGYDAVHLVVLIDGGRLWTGLVERNRELIDRMTELEAALWDRIVRRDPPEPDWTHPRTPELIRGLYGLDADKVVDVPMEIVAEWKRQKELAEQIKTLESEREIARAKVLHCLQDAGVGRAVDGSMELHRREVKGGMVPAFMRKGYTSVREVSK